MIPLHVSSAGPIGAAQFVVLVFVACTALAAVAALLFAPVLTAVLMVIAVAAGLLAFLMTPRRYELWPRQIAFVFPLWRWTLDYEKIEEVRHAEGTEPYQRYGLRYITISGGAVTLVMRRGFLGMKKIVISPEDREVFLRELARAMGR